MNQWDCFKNNELHSFVPAHSSVREQIFAYAEKFPDKPALISTSEGVSVSYRELPVLLEQFAQYVTERFGLQKGESISFLMENTIEILLMEWSSWSYGYVTVPLDSKRDTIERKIYKLTLAQAKVLFVRSGLLSEEEKRALAEALPSLSIIETASVQDFLSLIEKNAGSSELQCGGLDSDCLLLYTSGTTALPKGVRLTPRSLWADADQIARWLCITDKDRFHIVLPLHHINSTTFSLATVISGGTIILSPKYSKSEFWKTTAEYAATLSSIVPTIAVDLLSEQEKFKIYKDGLKDLSRIQIGSAPVQPTVVAQFYKQYGVRLIQGYGSTETSLRCLGVPLNVSEDEYMKLVESNAAGVEMVHTNVTVFRNDGSEAGEGEDGEICVRGPIIMRGYKDNDQATNEAFQHGWFHTGDVGYYKMYNEQKMYFLKGRSKELIIKGGINISPLAVEDAVLRAFPELSFCYAVGFPEYRLGETVGIVVGGSADTVSQLREVIAQSSLPGLSAFEQPAALLRLSSDDLPKTSSGKVQRMDIARQYGSQLRKESLTIVKTREHCFRVISPEDSELFSQMVEIYNSRWPAALYVDVSLIRDQVERGVVIGMFTHSDKLVGFISGVVFREQALRDHEEWAQTWDGMTAHGSFATHTQRGDALMCVGVTVKTEYKQTKVEIIKGVPDLPESEADAYIRSGVDPIMRFHQTPKGGFQVGAEILQILPHGRPSDSEALGYNVILKYPELDQEPFINEKASRGIQLVEAALVFAYRKKKKVYVYSRPAGLSQHAVIQQCHTV